MRTAPHGGVASRAYSQAARCAAHPAPVVTKRIPPPRSELSPGVRAHEAKLLAVMLRTSRLTWVFGEPGTDKGALLRSGVMPLLQRRRGDRAEAHDDAAAGLANPERRRPPARPRRELALQFDDWKTAPLTRLKQRIVDLAPAAAAEVAAGDPTLTLLLQRLHQRLGLRVVLVFDRFEDYLALGSDAAEVQAFANDLVGALLADRLPASFLIAMEETARPLLERFRARMPGFDDNVLRLSPIAESREQVLMPLPGVEHDATPVPQRRKPPPRAPVKVEDVYALIETTLAKTAELRMRASDADDSIRPVVGKSSHPQIK